MIACDCCDEWFHYKCIGIKTAPESDYFCQGCLSKAKQCANPECVRQSRETSKYCSNECGLKFNKLRYLKFFQPKWDRLKMNHSKARNAKMAELEKLEMERDEVVDRIGRLKNEKEELEQVIKSIKEHARKIGNESQSTKDHEDNQSESEMDEEEETISSDQSKTFCVICGVEQPADKAFKHWAMCHKRQESVFNFTSDVLLTPGCPTDPNPKLYCQREDKKVKRFCMNLESSCPQHSNWQHDPDEICGCPLKVMQKLEQDGNYCLKLKKNCNLHYNWDRFRLASKDMERLQAFTYYENLNDKIARTGCSLRDTYGGVVGIMLHNTIDEAEKDTDMIDVQ